jgi:iron complex transport system ATP-binding protein
MIIACQNMGRRIADRVLFDNLNVNFEPGSFVAILGRNGAGKTSLLRCLARIDTPSNGLVAYIDSTTKNHIPNGQIFQKLAWVPAASLRVFDFSLYDMVMMGRYPYHSGFPTDEDRAHCHSSIAAMQLSHLVNRSIKSLSTGEFQKALICRALALDPEVLILDEPAAHLDWPSAHGFLLLMRKLAEQGKTIISSIHDPLMAQKYAHRAVGLNDSKIFASHSVNGSIDIEFLKQIFGSIPEFNQNPLSH